MVLQSFHQKNTYILLYLLSIFSVLMLFCFIISSTLLFKVSWRYTSESGKAQSMGVWFLELSTSSRAPRVNNRITASVWFCRAAMCLQEKFSPNNRPLSGTFSANLYHEFTRPSYLVFVKFFGFSSLNDINFATDDVAAWG